MKVKAGQKNYKSYELPAQFESYKSYKRPVQHESLLQQECVKWFRYQYPYAKKLLFAIPNGGVRNKVTARRLKKEGVQEGVPDLFLAIPIDSTHGMFIEMKYGSNKTTDAQNEMIELFTKVGYKCEVCYTFDDFKKVIDDYLKK